jgi:hypothetical protein
MNPVRPLYKLADALSRRLGAPTPDPITRGVVLGFAMYLVAVALLALNVDAAFAANSASDVGRNLGGLLKSWASWLFGGATAIIAVSHLGRRDVAGAMVFAGMAILVGGFVLAGPQVAEFIKGIYEFADTGR